jgi:lipopolysaccharide/colanic/teichoic acid biosynthesis glycosyltransferase
MKRIIDILFAVFILLTFPVQLLLFGARVVKHAVLVLINQRTWIGYAVVPNNHPRILRGILDTTGAQFDKQQTLNIESLAKVDYWYATQYTCLHDAKLLIKHWRNLA